MDMTQFSPPVDQLLRLDVPSFGHESWLDYRELGLTAEHKAALLEMLKLYFEGSMYFMDDDEDTDGDDNEATARDLAGIDSALVETEGKEEAEEVPLPPEYWAPAHAWRALAQVGTDFTSAELESLLDVLDEGLYGLDDYIIEDFCQLFLQIGAPAVPSLIAALNASWEEIDMRGYVAVILGEMGGTIPEIRQACIDAVHGQFLRYRTNAREFNTELAAALATMYAIDSLPTILRAANTGYLDTSDPYWKDVVYLFDLTPD
jgi:hypothetical protein